MLSLEVLNLLFVKETSLLTQQHQSSGPITPSVDGRRVNNTVYHRKMLNILYATYTMINMYPSLIFIYLLLNYVIINVKLASHLCEIIYFGTDGSKR